MHFFEPFHIYALKAKTFEQVELIEAKQGRETQTNIKPQSASPDWVVVILVPISFMFVCATISSIVFAFCKVTRDRSNKMNISHCQQVPCGTCRLFNNNHYLKCAVHPSVVLTKQALNCSDYLPW